MRYLAALPLIAMASPSLACTPVFSCTIADSEKRVEICQSGRDIRYAFGPQDAPELELQADVVTNYTPWPGVGRSYFESVTFFNGNYSYEIFYSFDRLDLEKPAEAGVTAYRGDEQFADLSCRPDSVRQDFDVPSKEMARVGLCWGTETRKWAACPDG